MSAAVSIDLLDWFLFSDVDGVYLTILRITVFAFPLYLLLSRYYGHLGRLPSWFLANRYEGKRVSTLTFLPPDRVPFRTLYVASIVSCVTGLLGVLPSVSAVVASVSIIVLNNYYSTISTSDLEVLPYVVGMWTFAVLDPGLTAPLWVELGGVGGPDAPAYPFRLVQLYFCSVFFINGMTKVPFWRDWIGEKGVFHDAQNWNNLSPYLDTHWPRVRWTRDVPYLWETLGFLTIVIELGAVIPLVYPPAMVVVFPGLLGLFVGNHLLRTTSFLLLPWLYAACFLPWIVGVIGW